MTDIRDYPNPLLKAFSERFNLGIVFDARGVPVLNNNGDLISNGTKVSRIDFDAFLGEAYNDNRNLYRLMSDGSVRQPTTKVFYDGQTNGVYNSVNANSFVERAGPSAVSIDRTKLGQFIFRSQLESFINGYNAEFYNQQLSGRYASTNPVKTNVSFVPKRIDYVSGVTNIFRDIELPAALAASADDATFNGPTKKLILEASAGAPEGVAKKLANFSSVADAYWDANRRFEPRVYTSNVVDPIRPPPGSSGFRLILGGMDVTAEWVQKIAPGVNLAPIEPGLIPAGQITKAVAAAEQSFWKTIRSYATTGFAKVESMLGSLFNATNAAFEKSVATLAEAITIAAEKSAQAADFARTTVSQTWRQALEVAAKLTEGAQAAGEAVTRNLARWQKAFLDVIPNYFEGLPEQLVKTGKSIAGYYKQAFNDVIGLLHYDGRPVSYSLRLTGTVAGAMLAILDGVAEYKKEGGFTPGFFLWAAKTAAIMAVAIPVIGSLAGLAISTSPVWGTVGVVAFMGAGFYFGVRSVAQNLTEAYANDTSSPIYKAASTVFEYFKKFEGTATSYLKEAASLLSPTTQAKQLLAGINSIAIDTFHVATAGAAAFTYDEKNAWLWGIDDGVILGGDKNDWLFHTGFGTAYGGKGDDVIVGILPKVLKAGEKIGPAPAQGQPDTRNTAAAELTLTLDGGDGNDWVIAALGDKAVTAGGLGRDWIYNRSMGGVIWGDTINNTYEKPVLDAQGNPVLNPDGSPKTAPTKPEDNEANADNIWYSPNTIVKDAQHHDVLKFYGLTLTGGDASGGIAGLVAFGGLGAVVGMANFIKGLDANGKYQPANSIYFDHLFPWMTYTFQPNGKGGLDMFVTNTFDLLFTAALGITASDGYKAQQELDKQGILKGWMKVENFDLVGSFIGEHQDEFDGQGTFGMVFKAVNPLADIMEELAPIVGLIGRALAAQYGGMKLVDQALTLAAAVTRYAVGMDWAKNTDPLVIDLDGDGIETTEIATTQVYFDVDGDLFAERTGWLSGDDGFLVRDLNGNGRIDNISEMFGGVGESGFAQLAELDSDGDGKITAADLRWSELKVWQDYNGDGVTDAGELKTLDELGIVTLDLGSTAIDIRNPQGAHLTAFGDITFQDGAVRHMFDAILLSNDTDTRFAGESGRADWQFASTLDVKGFGRITNLSVAMANDIVFDQLATTTAAAMTTPKLRTLVAQVGDILGAWGSALEQTRELTPVLVGLDVDSNAVLLDRGVYVEDAQGGYWTLASGAPVLDAQGQPIARATLEDVLAQAAASGATWRLEQTWSPSSREAALTDREAAPYLMSVVNGRAVILDYGIQQADGSWKLASDSATTYATKADILALAHPTGTEWRTEELGFNPYANLPVDRIGVRFTDGIAVDYTVKVTDQDGTFYVWARNLDRALQLEWKTGDSREFNLRNFAVDFESLDEVNSTDDSTYRVEMLTPAQFHFATSLGGVDFHPEMLTAHLDNATGHIAYAVGPGGSANLSTDPAQYVSGIETMIDMLQPVMEAYIATSRRYAVRIAMQGGLGSFFDGVEYDIATDSYKPTTNRELAPMFEAIFAGAPASNADDAVFDYLAEWHAILSQVYPDYHPSGEGNLGGSTLKVDQSFIMQMMLPAFETVGVDLDIRGVAHALGNQRRAHHHPCGRRHRSSTAPMRVDYFYMTEGNQTLRGGLGADFYFVGRNSGDDFIYDMDHGDADELRFTDVLSSDVKAIRDGEDLILQIRGRTNTIRLTDQFLGERNELLSNGKRADTGVAPSSSPTAWSGTASACPWKWPTRSAPQACSTTA